MGIPRHLRAAALVAAAMLMGLLTVQGSYALWAVAASATPGTATAASFDVSLTGTPTGQVTNMTLPGGQAAIISLNPSTALTPGNAVYSSVSAINNSDAGGQFNISVTAGAPVVSNVAGGALATYVTVAARTAATAGTCGTTNYLAIPAGGLTSVAVPKGTSATLCFEVRLASNAPATVKGQSVTITIPLTATQLCGVPSGCA
ncbi:hypothetical protein ACFRAU_03820 [Arthrobacter sp. NPDC056691]|uniref:hypothetical protein n=1 Tax=Arthrobacter sp. NPDC056691 TaxID=3345913 RepID=UPI00366B1544